MKNKIFKAISDFNMLEGTSSVLVGVSGGMDSISMLHFFVNNFKGLNIRAVHINHNLRGEESARDEQFVRAICKKFEIECTVGSFDVFQLSKNYRKGIEETAREIRYDFFNKVAKKNKAIIATAHTLSDSIETIFFNLARGCGLSGFRGIPAKRNNIIRPLIYVSRTEIESYIKTNNLDYVNDSSNFSDVYSRNKIRHNVIPEFVKINRNFEQNVGRFIYQVQKEDEYLDCLSKKAFEDSNFSCEKIKILPIALKNRVLKLILDRFGTNIEFRHIKLADDLIGGNISAFNLSEHKRVSVKDGFLVCEDFKEIESFRSFNSKKFSVRAVLFGDSKFDCKEFDDCFFDLRGNILNFEFRTRRSGDLFCPKNRKCTKLLRKLFNELKIPIFQRSELGVLVDKSCNQLVWVESVGVSEKYRINQNTRLIGKVCVE